MGRRVRGGPLSLRQRAGIALAVWAVTFFVLAAAAAIPAGPTASLSVDDPMPFVGQTVHFDASASVGHDQGLGRIVAYRFDFGDGAGTQDQVSPTASHAYADVGAKQATVVVQDARGNTGSAARTIDVQPRPISTGPAPDLTPVAAATFPARPMEGQVVSVSITIVNHGGSTADAATIDVSDTRPNGTTVSIGQTLLPGPLQPGAAVTVYSESFVAAGVGDHTLRIVVGNVTPPETYTQDNVRTVTMTVLPSSGPPPPTGGGVPVVGSLFVIGLGAAGVVTLLVAGWLLLTPPESGPGPLEPPPAEPPDRSPPPIRPP